jgi:hypothetical protein
MFTPNPGLEEVDNLTEPQIHDMWRLYRGEW